MPSAPLSNWTPPTPKESWVGGTGIHAMMKDPLMVATMMQALRHQQEKQKAEEEAGSYYGYGKATSIDDILAAAEADDTKQALANESALSSNRFSDKEENRDLPAYRKGGKVSSALIAASGKHIPDNKHPEYDGSIPVFRTGGGKFHVQGPGDGQSDDIPAMLADGEFVFDADTVSQLGNGSNKAGADILNAMREALRLHKRSAPIGKIPPKSKSALQYIAEGMKMKKLK